MEHFCHHPTLIWPNDYWWSRAVSSIQACLTATGFCLLYQQNRSKPAAILTTKSSTIISIIVLWKHIFVISDGVSESLHLRAANLDLVYSRSVFRKVFRYEKYRDAGRVFDRPSLHPLQFLAPVPVIGIDSALSR